jgi:UDP-2,3-diacylglucosamine hydrolase
MENIIKISTDKKIYFVSDAHLGAPNKEGSLIREKKLVSWLDKIQTDASHLFLVGDIFDFWFEYKRVVPRGFIRLLGKLQELAEKGIKLYFFTGNHDMWTFDYLQDEIGMQIFRKPQVFLINNKKYFIGHGDGLGPGDKKYKFLKSFFSSKFCQWMFARLHPNFAFWIAQGSSNSSRKTHEKTDHIFMGEEKEMLVQYAKQQSKTNDFDYFVFGHRHLPLEIKINENTTYFSIGDWITHFSYIKIDGDTPSLFSEKKLS